MTEPSDELDAALWAAGALTAAEHEALRERMKTDRVFAQKADEWEQALSPLAQNLVPLTPPDGLMDKIEARLAERIYSATLGRILRADEGEWLDMGPGLRYKILHRNHEQQRQTILLEAAPGAIHPAHIHDFDEEIYVISGDLTIDGVELGPGDFRFSPKGSDHPAEITRQGCRCLITAGF